MSTSSLRRTRTGSRVRLVGVAAALAVISLARPGVADDWDGPGDGETKGGAQAATWEPVIAALYVRPSASSPKEYVPVDAPPGALEGWAALKDAVRIHKPGAAYPPGELVYSGWRLLGEGENAGLGFESQVAGRDGKDAVPTFPKNERLLICSRVDVLTSLSDDQKSTLVDRWFQVAVDHFSVHRVSEDPKDFRAGASADPIQEAPYRHNDQRERSVMPKFNLPGSGPTGLSMQEWVPRTKGTFEIQLRMRLSGRFDESQPPEQKECEGAIRIAIADQSMTIEKIFWDHEKGGATPKPQGGAPGGR